MPVILGAGAYRYEVLDDWAKLPPGREFNADVAAVGVDRQDRVYAFNRGPHPMVVFDRDGNFLRSWGEGVFHRAHGVHMAPDDTLWLTDDGDHTVRHCTLDGKVLLTIGIPGAPTPYMSGEPFHRCTHTALSPQGDLYVSDGYGNARVHKYSPDGKLLLSWGEPGTDPGSSTSRTTSAATPTAGSTSPTARTTACRCSTATAGTRRSGTTCTGPRASTCSAARQPRFYVGEIGGGMAVNHDMPNIGPRVSIYSRKGELLARLGHAAGRARARASSSRRTASPSTRAATSTSARCRSRTGATATRASRTRRGCAACRSSSRWPERYARAADQGVPDRRHRLRGQRDARVVHRQRLGRDLGDDDPGRGRRTGSARGCRGRTASARSPSARTTGCGSASAGPGKYSTKLPAAQAAASPPRSMSSIQRAGRSRRPLRDPPRP